MKILNEAEAIVAIVFVMPDMPIRMATETAIRLYENGYAMTVPESAEAWQNRMLPPCAHDAGQICGYLNRDVCPTHRSNSHDDTRMIPRFPRED